jgi:hypothetical protein
MPSTISCELWVILDKADNFLDKINHYDYYEINLFDIEE